MPGQKIRFGCALAVVAMLSVAAAAAEEMRVTLLGTGSPVPSAERFSQSTLVEAGGQRLLFDIGRGATIRLAQLQIPLGSVDAHFITHFHSDHLSGLTDLWGTGWLPTNFGGRKTPMVIYGPEGTREMTDHLTQAFRRDIEIRIADELLPPAGIAFDVTEIAPGPVYDRDGVTVTAFEVHHGDLIKPAMGYRIDYDGKTVVISGDTTYDPRIAEQAGGADLLIHEVASIDPALIEKFPRLVEIGHHHTLPEEAGRIFSAARPKLAAYSHIILVQPGQGIGEDLDVTPLLTRTRETYDGPLIAGEDLMSFTISDGAVTVTGPDGTQVMRVE